MKDVIDDVNGQGVQKVALSAGCDADLCALVVSYPLSVRHLEEMMAERGVSVGHSTVHRCAIRLLPALGKGVSTSQTRSRQKVADGQNLRQGQWGVGVIVSCR